MPPFKEQMIFFFYYTQSHKTLEPKEGIRFSFSHDCVCCQILETIPVSDDVSELVQKLGSFYTEVDGEGEEVEENEVDKRPFTRPFAGHAGKDDVWRYKYQNLSRFEGA